MKKLLAMTFAFVLLLSACAKDSVEKADEITKVTVAELASGLYEYNGGKVEVSGLCVHVCSHSGKKMFLVGDNPEDRFMIFADEGISGFPKDIEGSKIVVVGMLEEEKLDMAYAENLEAELAGELTDDPEHSCEFEDNMKQIADLKEKIKNSKKGYLSKYTMTTKEYKAL